MSRVDSRAVPDTLSFRRTMGLFATGVAVLATRAQDGEPVGMTANAITSVSLDPMLVLVCVTRTANIAPYLLDSPRFSLSFLSAAQEPLSGYFAGLWDDDAPPPPFAFEDWQGDLLLAGCIGAVACRRYAVYDGGDHWIVLGEVTALHRAANGESPLIFYRGGYHRLAAGPPG